MLRFHRVLLISFFTVVSLGVVAQGYNVGIRAGLGQNKFSGPTERGESFKLAGGFHFGINFQWNFNDIIGLRSEVVYNQTGSGYELDVDDGYYVFTPVNSGLANIIIRDSSNINMDHSNAYIQLPQTVHIRVNQKFEIFAGGYVGFLVSPVGSGTQLFGGTKGAQEHSFLQGLNFKYASDDENTRLGDFINPASPLIEIRANGIDVDVRAFENSYDYQSFNTADNRFLSIDYGLVLGGTYYLNRGLFVMGRVEYGAKDITRNSADYSFTDVNDDETPIFNNDNDKNLGFYLSLGFKF